MILLQTAIDLIANPRDYSLKIINVGNSFGAEFVRDDKVALFIPPIAANRDELARGVRYVLTRCLDAVAESYFSDNRDIPEDWLSAGDIEEIDLYITDDEGNNDFPLFLRPES